jgi:uncharacterized integral membrane protein
MLSKTHGMPVHSAAPGVIPDPLTGPRSNGAPVAREQHAAGPRPARKAAGGESRPGRLRRNARLTRLHGYAIAIVALGAFLIALAASNTAHVKVNWVFGTSHVSLVWLVLFAAILGWLLGLATSARFHWSTRAPRRGGAAS